MSYVLLQISLQNIISFFFFLVSKLPDGRCHDDVIYILYMYQGRIQDLWLGGASGLLYMHVIIELLYYILNLLVSSKLSFIAATTMLYMSK